MWDFSRFYKNVALLDEYGQSVSYKEMDEIGRIISKKIGKRCLVFMLCENRIGSVIGYSAFVQNGIVPVLLSAKIEKDFLCNMIETYCPSYLWMPVEMTKNFSTYEIVYETCDYALVKTNTITQYELFPELCLMLTTSGSTGSPKFVRQSYKNVESNAKSIVSYLGIGANERAITTLPMNYTYGLSIINSHFMVGATILVTEKGLMQKEFWRFFNEGAATSFGGVPYTYEMLDKLRFFRMNLPTLRYMTQAGGKITPELHAKFAQYAQENGKKFIVMYGQCEATARMGYLPAEKAVEKCGSMGIAIPGGRFRLIDSRGDEITEPYVTGELVYEGENVTLGYAECGEELKKGDERKGILHTGDMAQFDEDGYYYIVGRKKRFLKIYGNRVNLDEIDRLIKSQYEGIECASSGVDDHMYIFITDDVKAAEIKSFVSQKTKLNPSAFCVLVLDEIPKNDAGKTLYKELSKYYQ